MWRWTRRALIGLGGLLVLAALVGAAYQWIATRRDLAATPAPGRLVDIGGHRLHLWCTGSGSPAVILENGLGGSTAGWGFVQPAVAGFTRACSYDHAGIGYSDPGPSPRTTRRLVQELAALLDRGGIAGPLVLVGASLGGFTVRVFASEHAPRVAGLVLVDASHEDQQIDVPRIAPLMPLLAAAGVLRLSGMSLGQDPASLAPEVRGFARATRFRTAGYRATVDEFLHARESAAEVRATRRRLTVPVVVVTAGRGSDAAWRALQADQAGLSKRGCLVVAEKSGHVVAVDQPQIVVEAIRAVVDAARGSNDGGPCAGPFGRKDTARPD
jgi:pimeloyl-ACP methyl ester carboxylesterase